MDRYIQFLMCVESVLAQAYEPLEIVIVVDGTKTVFDRYVTTTAAEKI